MNRRAFHLAAVAAVAAAASRLAQAQSGAAQAPAEIHDMSQFPASWTGKEQIAMLVYPEFTALDLIGPQYLFASLMGASVHIVGKSRQPVTSDTRVTIVPSMSFAECPADLDILFVPGGTQGTLAAMQDKATLDFLADRGARAKLVTSVCTGSLVLGAAGLLKGYRATSHWITRDLLAEFGATPVAERFVFDRNRVTGAGVTAGIDFGLALVERMRDTEYARAVQLLAEYDPAPPFNAGTPAKAGAKTTQMIAGMLKGFNERVRGIARKGRTQ
jgi:putative intracellular protease/amidase